MTLASEAGGGPEAESPIIKLDAKRGNLRNVQGVPLFELALDLEERRPEFTQTHPRPLGPKLARY